MEKRKGYSVNLVIEQDSLLSRYDSLSGKEIVSGNFYLEVAGIFYASEHWNDFVVRLLMSWSHNLLNNRRGVLCFFDGPYEIKFVQEKNITLTLEEIGEYQIEIDEFYEGLSRCLIIVERYIKENNILIDRQKVIRKYINQLKNIANIN